MRSATGAGPMSPERFEELYERYCDGVLNAGEQAEFKSALRVPVFAKKLVELSTFEAVVHDELRLAEEEDEAKATALRPVSGVRSAIASGSRPRMRAAVSHRRNMRRPVRPQSSYLRWRRAATFPLVAIAAYFKFG